MKPKPEGRSHDRQDWGIVVIILLFGFLCVLIAGQWALRFSPSWTLNADMDSDVNVDSEFLTRKPVGLFEPVDPAILTQPAWANALFTPGAKIITRTPLPPPADTDSAATETTAPTAVPTNTILVTSTVAPTNTLVWLPLPPTSTHKPKDTDEPPQPPTALPTNIPIPSANLTITNADDAAFYDAGSLRIYTIEVTNLGPDNVSGATVANIFAGGPVASSNWGCIPLSIGAACGAGGVGNINDLVDLPVGASIRYTVNVAADSFPTADLAHTASVNLPANYASPTSFSATDTDTLIVNTSPPGISVLGDPLTSLPADGSSTILRIDGADIDDDAGYDLVYYEEPSPPGILMDKIIFEISDGKNWYPLFNWGDDAQNNGTNLILPIVPETTVGCGSVELDNCEIDASLLQAGTGVLIDIPASIPNTTAGHFYIRITVPVAGPGDDGDVQLDAILPWP